MAIIRLVTIPIMNIPFNPPIRTIAELLHQLGDIPPQRVRFNPVPGTATIDDLLQPENAGCELVDGTLVEKAMGWEESLLAIWVGTLLTQFVNPRNLGIITGADGTMKLFPDIARAPDVAFTSWDRMPGRRRPSD
jgi:Uma2 family endonuclease